MKRRPKSDKSVGVMHLVFLTLSFLATEVDALPAFPGAEGFGADTPGGRGGQVVKVTNLEPSGPGSLNAACQTKGPRIVVFEVSYSLVLARAGCFPRDVVTRRTVEEVKSGTGSWGRRATKDLLAGLRPGTPTMDSDDDGTPDVWEDEHGLDRLTEDSVKQMPSCCTAIEEYLHALAAKLLEIPR